MKNFWTVLRKEFLETFRDVRSLIMLFVPVLIFPLMFSFVGTQIDKAQEDVKKEVKIAVSDASYIELFSGEERFKAKVFGNVTEAVRCGDANIGVSLGNEGIFVVEYDAGSMYSASALAEITAVLDVLREQAIFDALEASGGDVSSMSAYLYETKAISSDDSAASSIIVSLAPMMIIMFIFSGGMSAAVDCFAGEKERKTMESVLFTQAERGSIYFAKFMNVTIISLISMLLSVGGYVISLLTNDSLVKLYGEEKISFASAKTILPIIIIVFSTALFSSALMSFLSVSARGTKEAQMRMSILIIAPSVLSMAVMYMENSKINLPFMFVPIMNAILDMKLLFSGIINYTYFFIVIGSNILYSLIFCFISSRYFKSEKIL